VIEESDAGRSEPPASWSRRMEYLIPLGILAVWIILQVWILPKAGVPT